MLLAFITGNSSLESLLILIIASIVTLGEIM